MYPWLDSSWLSLNNDPSTSADRYLCEVNSATGVMHPQLYWHLYFYLSTNAHVDKISHHPLLVWSSSSGNFGTFPSNLVSLENSLVTKPGWLVVASLCLLRSLRAHRRSYRTDIACSLACYEWLRFRLLTGWPDTFVVLKALTNGPR